jgi:hypothetical protein
MDMSAAIIPKSDQLNSDDLIAGPITVTITAVTVRGGQEQPVSIHFEGDNGKPYKPCKSMSRVLVSAWGPDSSKYVGRSMALYRDPSVKWAGMEVGGIRISHMSDIAETMTMALTATKGSRKPFMVKPLAAREKPPTLDSVLAAIGTMSDKPSRDAAKALASRLEDDDDIAAAKSAFTAKLETLRAQAETGPV